jgi:hypothetical protein
MGHATLVNDGLFWFLILLTLLMMMFIYAVIATPPQDAVRSEPPTLNAPAPPPPDYAARHTPAAAPVISPPKASSGPRWGPVGAFILAIAGLATAMTGGRMFLGTSQAPMACSHQAVAVCLQGYVLLDATQLLGGAIAVAGIGLIVNAIVLALR